MPRRSAPLALYGLLLVWPLLCAAGIYRYTDAQGNTHYTSQPPEGVQADEVRLPPNSPRSHAPASSTSSSNNSQSNSSEPVTNRYSVIRLIGLEDEALRANGGLLSIEVQLLPALQAGHNLRLLLDGQVASPAGTATQRRLSAVERGQHSLQVEILNEQQVVIQRSAVSSFNVQRTHLNSPARRAN